MGLWRGLEGAIEIAVPMTVAGMCSLKLGTDAAGFDGAPINVFGSICFIRRNDCCSRMGRISLMYQRTTDSYHRSIDYHGPCMV